MEASIKKIEDMSLNAWPSHKMELYDGWILRFSEQKHIKFPWELHGTWTEPPPCERDSSFFSGQTD